MHQWWPLQPLGPASAADVPAAPVAAQLLARPASQSSDQAIKQLTCQPNSPQIIHFPAHLQVGQRAGHWRLAVGIQRLAMLPDDLWSLVASWRLVGGWLAAG